MEVTYVPGRSWIVTWRDTQWVLFVASAERKEHTHPCKIQGHHEHEMGGENNHEIPRRILRNSIQNGGNISKTPGLRLSCPKEDQQESKNV